MALIDDIVAHAAERLGLGGRTQPVDVDELIAGPSDPEAQAELSQVYRRLDAFPVEERVALVLQRVEGLELTEIAARMAVRAPSLIPTSIKAWILSNCSLLTTGPRCGPGCIGSPSLPPAATLAAMATASS